MERIFKLTSWCGMISLCGALILLAITTYLHGFSWYLVPFYVLVPAALVCKFTLTTQFPYDLWITLLALIIITWRMGFQWPLIPFYVLLPVALIGDIFLSRRKKQKT
ncbi:MAG: hypothetical protein LBU44_05290 [Mediterranea sp.]|jgi:hypothetical protein|nr:hypothetical protein [Mediterranea sp.]